MSSILTLSVAAEVAAEVRAEMARQRFGQQAIADALGVSRQAISRRFTGEVPWDVAELAKVAEFLGKPLAHFIPGASS